MDFREPPRPARAEAVLPMINLVFLLLIFFLMVAILTPPAPVEVTPPRVASAPALAPEAVRVHLDAAGIFAFGAMRGREAEAGVAAALAAAPGPVALHADRAAPAARVARLVAALVSRGAAPVWLVVEAGS